MKFVRGFIKIFSLLWWFFLGAIAIYALFQEPVLKAISWFGLFVICGCIRDLIVWAWSKE